MAYSKKKAPVKKGGQPNRKPNKPGKGRKPYKKT